MSMMIELRPDAGPALVVGGGQVALRKVRNLSEGQFRIVVIAPEVREEITLAPFVTVHPRAFTPADLVEDAGYALVFACTNDREVNKEVGALARRANIPVVVADAQDESTFFTPAALREGDLIIAVSTGGASPSLARQIRERVVAVLGPGWSQVVQTARREREERLGRQRASQEARQDEQRR